MFHKAIDLKFLDGTALAVTFQDGKVKRYDMRCLFSKYPQLKALEDRELFLSGKLMGAPACAIEISDSGAIAIHVTVS